MPTTEGKTSSTKSTATRTTTSPTQGIDLAQLFGAAAQALATNQGALNQADAKGVHGDHVVQTFQLITDAVSATKGKPPADQLAYASKKLTDHAKVSTSAKVYAQGLSQASQQMKGQSAVTPDMAMSLVQTLLAGGQQPQAASQQNAGADMLGALLGGMSGQQPASSQSSAGADLLGALLGGAQPQGQQQSTGAADLMGALLGGTQQPQQTSGNQSGLDMGDLLNAGLTFMQAKQQGKDNMEAAVSALMSASPLNQKPAQQQSGQLVASTLLQAISMFAKK